MVEDVGAIGKTRVAEADVADTRARIIGATAELFRAYGYTGTGLKQISATAGAPFGSLYHFFPGGKEELGAAAILASGQWFADLVMGVLTEVDDPVAAIRGCFAKAAEDLVDTDYADACPIATVALEISSTSEVLRAACAEVFESWIAGLAGWLVQGGVAEQAARDLALQTISVLEGAFVLSRAMRNTESLLAAGALMGDRVQAAIAAASPGATPDPAGPAGS